MKQDTLIRDIVFIPRLFRETNNMSIYDLLKKTGYFQLHREVLEENIYDELFKEPKLVDEWLFYSSNKRSYPGYYFTEIKSDIYVVGYIDGTNKKIVVKESPNKLKICAQFIKQEVESIRNNI